MVLLYHERQEAALCGVHCVNCLLQGPVFTEWDLARAAHQLDKLEHELMASQGVETSDFVKFAAEGSGNVARDGMFSIQVRFMLRPDTRVDVWPVASRTEGALRSTGRHI
jgi:Ataxin-3